jgi:hypothetical protein
VGPRTLAKFTDDVLGFFTPNGVAGQRAGVGLVRLAESGSPV